MENKDKFVLVTGGAGYVGAVLVGELLEQGHKVRVLDNFIYGMEPLSGMTDNRNLEVVVGDIRKIDDIKKALKDDVWAVVHLAAVVGDPACSIQADTAVETNLLSTIRLAQMCKDVERFIFPSTCSVYGASDANISDENSKTNPVSLYAKTKLQAEKALLSLRDKYPVPVILRLATLFGLSPRMRFDLVVNFFVKKALKDKEFKVFGGEQWRPFVHVSDVANAIQLALNAPIDKVDGKIFNVGFTEENYQIKDIAGLVKKHIPEVAVQHVKEITDRRSYHVSFEKIKRVLELKSSKTIEDGILEIKAAIESDKIPNPDDPRYYNVILKR